MFLKNLTLFKSIARPVIGDGWSIQLWYDARGERELRYLYPKLFSYAANKGITLHQVKMLNPAEDLFHLPLFTEAFK